MDDETVKKAKRNRVMKIGIPVLIVIVIAGIWFLKNIHNGEALSVDDNHDFTLNVTETLDLDKLKSYGLPIILDFGSDSCIPCKQMAPVLESLNAELKGKAIVRFVDVWKYPDLANGFPISVIPTQVLIDAAGKPYNPESTAVQNINYYATKDTNKLVFTTHEGPITKEDLLAILKEMGMR